MSTTTSSRVSHAPHPSSYWFRSFCDRLTSFKTLLGMRQSTLKKVFKIDIRSAVSVFDILAGYLRFLADYVEFSGTDNLFYCFFSVPHLWFHLVIDSKKCYGNFFRSYDRFVAFNGSDSLVTLLGNYKYKITLFLPNYARNITYSYVHCPKITALVSSDIYRNVSCKDYRINYHFRHEIGDYSGKTCNVDRRLSKKLLKSFDKNRQWLTCLTPDPLSRPDHKINNNRLSANPSEFESNKQSLNAVIFFFNTRFFFICFLVLSRVQLNSIDLGYKNKYVFCKTNIRRLILFDLTSPG